MKSNKLNAMLKEKVAELIGDLNNEFISATSYGKNNDVMIEYLTIHYIHKEDYPNNIPQNSIYLQFRINYKESTVCCPSNGHIWLTDIDQRKSYLAMTSIKNLAKYDNEKWFRTQHFKSIDDLARRISDFYFTIFGILSAHTTGYPYKHMATNIY